MSVDVLAYAMTIGPRFCGYHPRHVDLRVFWCRRSVRSVSPFRLCAPHSAPPLFFLRCRKPHLPTCGRLLRRRHCHQVLRSIYQVRSIPFPHTRDERRQLMRWALATLSSSNHSFPTLSLRYTMTSHLQIQTRQRGRSVDTFGSLLL